MDERTRREISNLLVEARDLMAELRTIATLKRNPTRLDIAVRLAVAETGPESEPHLNGCFDYAEKILAEEARRVAAEVSDAKA